MPDISPSRYDVGARRLPKSVQSIAAPELATPWAMPCNNNATPLRRRAAVSAKFVLPDHDRPAVKHDEYTDLEIPVIDMAAIKDEQFELGSNEAADLVAQVREACLEWGFFQIVNHDIPEELLARVQHQAKNFFQLPFSEKMKVAKTQGFYTGYGHATVKKGDVRPWSEGFYFANDGSTHEFALKLWPRGDNPDFVVSYNEYNEKVQRLAGRVLRIIVAGLTVDPAHFERYTSNTGGLLRWNFYPACPEPQKTLGLNAHTDFNLLTVLHQGDVGGLQIEKDGKWIAVRPRPGALAVNIGDTLQVLTNGRYKSVPHRAVVNASTPRVSLAYFFVPLKGVDIVPAPDLVDERNPPLYKPFTFETYTAFKQTQLLNTLDHFLVPKE